MQSTEEKIYLLSCIINTKQKVQVRIYNTGNLLAGLIGKLEIRDKEYRINGTNIYDFVQFTVEDITDITPYGIIIKL